MVFPHYFNVFGHRIHPHPAMELIAYTAGFQLYLFVRRRYFPRASMPIEKNLWLIVACVFGALFGSKILAWVESPMQYWDHRDDLKVWLGGKTIVGGLLGGWIGVEIAKKILHIENSTGDAFVFPLILGIAIGRIGCFLTGLDDHTYGKPTALPWAIDFGDGIPRHPTQLYEILFLLTLGAILLTRAKKASPNGALFRLFILAYLTFRFAIEFIKPRFTYPAVHLSAIQIAAACGIVVCVQLLRGMTRHNTRAEAEARA